jgi:hypothetical protein
LNTTMRRFGSRASLVLLAGVVVLGLGSGTPAQAKAPTKQLLTGTILQTQFFTGGRCNGGSGYEDIAVGALVLIRNQAGQIIARSRVKSSQWTRLISLPPWGAIATCKLTISTYVTPAKSYTIQIGSHRSRPRTLAEMKAKRWKVQLSWG